MSRPASASPATRSSAAGVSPSTIGVDQRRDVGVIGEPGGLAHVVGRETPVGEGEHLVEDRLGVSHAAVGQSRDEGQGVVIGLGSLCGDDAAQLGDDGRIGQPAKVVALRAADDRGRHLVGIGRGQDEDDVVGGLLDQLQQRVEGVRAEHVNLVDDVDPAAELGRRGQRPHHELAGVLDRAMAGGVDLDNVERASVPDRDACGAGVTRVAVGAEVGAVDRLGEDSGRRRLARPARADEQVGVRQPIAADGTLERGDDRVLADQLGESLRAEAPVQCAMRCGRRRGLDIGNGLGCGHEEGYRTPIRTPPSAGGGWGLE